MLSFFSVYGVAVDVVAGNMPFENEAMKQFFIERGFNVTVSSPYHRSNDIAKRYMLMIKQLPKKAADLESDIHQ